MLEGAIMTPHRQTMGVSVKNLECVCFPCLSPSCQAASKGLDVCTLKWSTLLLRILPVSVGASKHGKTHLKSNPGSTWTYLANLLLKRSVRQQIPVALT